MTTITSYRVRGFVAFPTADPRYHVPGEGGLRVDLLIVPSDLGICSGGLPRFDAQNGVIGIWDGAAGAFRTIPDPHAAELGLTELIPDQAVVFPDTGNPSVPDDARTLSHEGVLIALLGETDWDGTTADGHWVATPDTLTPAGQVWLDLTLQLYQGCTWYMITSLDT